MNSERRPGIPNEEPDDQEYYKDRREEWLEQERREYKRRYRPIRLHVTSAEREHITPLTDEDWWRLLVALIRVSSSDADLVQDLRDDFKQTLKDAKEIDKAHAQLTPLTPEEVQAQDAEGALKLVKTARTMSRKINLVEKLQPGQLNMLKQRDPKLIEPVIAGLTKRPDRKERAQRRILDIYQRRGEDEPRP